MDKVFTIVKYKAIPGAEEGNIYLDSIEYLDSYYTKESAEKAIAELTDKLTEDEKSFIWYDLEDSFSLEELPECSISDAEAEELTKYFEEIIAPYEATEYIPTEPADTPEEMLDAANTFLIGLKQYLDKYYGKQIRFTEVEEPYGWADGYRYAFANSNLPAWEFGLEARHASETITWQFYAQYKEFIIDLKAITTPASMIIKSTDTTELLTKAENFIVFIIEHPSQAYYQATGRTPIIDYTDADYDVIFKLEAENRNKLKEYATELNSELIKYVRSKLPTEYVNADVYYNTIDYSALKNTFEGVEDDNFIICASYEDNPGRFTECNKVVWLDKDRDGLTALLLDKVYELNRKYDKKVAELNNAVGVHNCWWPCLHVEYIIPIHADELKNMIPAV